MVTADQSYQQIHRKQRQRTNQIAKKYQTKEEIRKEDKNKEHTKQQKTCNENNLVCARIIT